VPVIRRISYAFYTTKRKTPIGLQPREYTRQLLQYTFRHALASYRPSNNVILGIG